MALARDDVAPSFAILAPSVGNSGLADHRPRSTGPHARLAMARRPIPRVTESCLHPLGVGRDALPEVPGGSTAWFDWLEAPDQRSFSYAGPSGTFTARRER